MERDEISMMVARNIEAVMSRKGILMAEVNKRAHLGQTGVNDLLSGKSRDPRISTLRKIAEDALGIPVVALFSDPKDDQVAQEIFEILGLLPETERRKFLRIARAMAHPELGSDDSDQSQT